MRLELQVRVSELDWTSAQIEHTLLLDCDAPGGDTPQERAHHITSHYTVMGSSFGHALHTFLLDQTAEQLERGVMLGDDPRAVEVYRKSFENASRQMNVHGDTDGDVAKEVERLIENIRQAIVQVAEEQPAEDEKGIFVMPFKSEKQRRFMHSQHPDIAKRWEKEAKKEGKPAVQPKKKAKPKK